MKHILHLLCTLLCIATASAQKISELPSEASPDSTDQVPLLTSSTSTLYRATVASLLNLLNTEGVASVAWANITGESLSIAALQTAGTPTANTVPVFTGSNTASYLTFPLFSQTFTSTGTSAAAMRTTLGLGDSAVLNVGTGPNTVASGGDTQTALDGKVDESGGSAVDLTLSGSTRVSPMYLMATFTTGEDALRLAASSDLTRWRSIGDVVYRPPLPDKLRDPQIIKWNDYFYIGFTAGDFGACTYFKIIRSKDLRAWETVATVSTASIGAVTHTWFGCWYVEGNTVRAYVAVSTNSLSTYAAYYLTATNSDLSTWSTPTAVGGSWPTQTIPQAVRKVGSTYQLWIKDDTDDYIEVAESSSPTTGFSLVETEDWAGWGSLLEGTALVTQGNRLWNFFDNYNAVVSLATLWYSYSDDGGATWSAKAQIDSELRRSNSSILVADNLADIEAISRAETPSIQYPAAYLRNPARYLGNSGTWVEREDPYDALVQGANVYKNSSGAFRSFTTSRPSWISELGWGSSVDSFTIYRAASGTGNLSFSNLFRVTPGGNGTFSGTTLQVGASTIHSGTKAAPSDTATPDAWEDVVISGTTFKRALYLP